MVNNTMKTVENTTNSLDSLTQIIKPAAVILPTINSNFISIGS